MNQIGIAFIVILLILIGGGIGAEMTYEKMKSNKAVSYYKGSIIIDKSKNSFQLDSCGSKRIIEATNYELSLYNLGNTIK